MSIIGKDIENALGLTRMDESKEFGTASVIDKPCPHLPFIKRTYQNGVIVHKDGSRAAIGVVV